MKTSSYTPGSIPSRDYEDALADPLHADLDILRGAAAAFALPNRRGHERLRRRPQFKGGVKVPLSSAEFTEAMDEMAEWSQLEYFDPYFCAGEMVAAFCEVLRRVRRRSGATSSSDLALILHAACAFADRLVFDLIDDSNGDHVFAGAHLDELRRVAQARLDAGDAEPTLVAVLELLNSGTAKP